MNIFLSRKVKRNLIAPVLAIVLMLPQGLALAEASKPTSIPTSDAGPLINATENETGFTIRQDFTDTGALVGDNLLLGLTYPIEPVIGGTKVSWQSHTLDESDIAANFYDFQIPPFGLQEPDLGATADGSRQIRGLIQYVTETGIAYTPSTSPLTLTLDTAAPAAPVITAVYPPDIGGNFVFGTAGEESVIEVFEGEQSLGKAVFIINPDGENQEWSAEVTFTTDGSHALTAKATDAAGNVSTLSAPFEVLVPDITPPVMTLNGETPMTVEGGLAFTDPGATASDNFDGNITAQILVTGSVNTAVIGAYELTYTVTDGNGNNATMTRTVNVVDTTKPVITLTGESTITVQPAATYIDPGATATDNVDGNITAKIVTTNPVNTQIANTYTVTYTVTDTAGNQAQLTRTVNVLAGGGGAILLFAATSTTPTPPAVAAPTAPQPQVLGASTVRFNEGDVMKLKGKDRYYLIKDGKRTRLPNWKLRAIFHGQYTEEVEGQTLFGVPYDRTPVDGIL